MRRKIYVCVVLAVLLLLALYPIPFMHCYFEHGYLRKYYLEEAVLSVRILIVAILFFLLISICLRKVLSHFESKNWTIKSLVLISVAVHLAVRIFHYCMGGFSGMSSEEVWRGFYGADIVYPRYLPLFLGLNIYYPIMLIYGAKAIAKLKTEVKYIYFFLWSVVQLYVIWPFTLFYDEADMIRLIFILGFAVIAHLICYYLYLYVESKPKKRNVAGAAFLAIVSAGILWYLKMEDQLSYLYARMIKTDSIKREIVVLFGNAQWFGSVEDESVYCPVINTAWFLLKETGWFWTVCYAAVILSILAVLWMICGKTKRKELSGISTMSCILISLRWVLWLAMTFGIISYETSYSVQPFYGAMAFYDILLIGIIIMPILPEKAEFNKLVESAGNCKAAITLKRCMDDAAGAAERAMDSFIGIGNEEEQGYDIDEEEWKEYQEWKKNKP